MHWTLVLYPIFKPFFQGYNETWISPNIIDITAEYKKCVLTIIIYFQPWPIIKFLKNFKSFPTCVLIAPILWQCLTKQSFLCQKIVTAGSSSIPLVRPLPIHPVCEKIPKLFLLGILVLGWSPYTRNMKISKHFAPPLPLAFDIKFGLSRLRKFLPN